MLHASLKGMLSRRLRLLLTGTSIALGVAFLAGTLMLTSSMQRAFDELFAGATASSDAVVRAETALEDAEALADRPSLPAATLDRVRDVDGVARAEGGVTGYALLIGADGKPVQPQGAPTLGSSLPTDEDLRGDLTLRSGRYPAGAGEIVIDATSAEKGDLSVGDTTKVHFASGARPFTVVGVVGFGDDDDLAGASSTYFDLVTAQRVLGKQGAFDTISVQAEAGLSDTEVTSRLAAALPDSVEAMTGRAVAEERADRAKAGLEFLNVALLAFAGIALFVGSFIIWNTFAMQVAQRRRELALLRAIGATRAQVMRTMLVESVVLGLGSSVIGVLLGIGLARGLVALMSGFGMSLPTAGIRLEPDAVVLGLLVGTVVTVVSAVVPARRATTVLPVEALRDSGPQAFRVSRTRIGLGSVLAVAGVTALLSALLGGAPTALVPLGAVGVVLGVATLAPAIVRPMAAVIGAPLRSRGVPGELARENAMRNPRRTASTAMALVIGLTMVAAVAVFAASLKASFGDVLTSTRADLYVVTPTDQAEGFSREVTREVRAVDGVDTVSPTGFGMARLDGLSQPFVSIDPATAHEVVDLGVESGSIADLGDSGVLVYHDVAQEKGIAVGDTVPAVFSGAGARDLEVVGVFDTKGFVSADYVISNRAHDLAAPHRLEGTTLVTVDDGLSVGTVQDRVDEVLESHPDATVMDTDEFQGAVGAVVDQLLGLVTVLLLLAVLIALLGIVNTLALSVFERTRELGMLRAIGLTRGQVRAMVRWESVVISTIGALLGAGLGIGLGLALTHSLADQGLSRMAVPGVQLALYVVAAALAGVVAAIGPARRAAKVDVLRAVSSE
jgi:putative ABC transport system permease protein